MQVRSLIVAVMLLPVAACQNAKPTPEQTSVAPAPPSAASPKAPAKSPLPAEPPGWGFPVDEAKMSAALSAPAYLAAWEPGHRVALNAMLTATSEMIANLEETGTKIKLGAHIVDEAKKHKLDDASREVFFYFSRTSAFPPEFDRRFREHLAATKTEPNLGTWTKWEKGKPVHDYSALAVVANRTKPEYIRALIAGRREGPVRWHKGKPLLRHYLASEYLALTWLGAVLYRQEPEGAFTAAEEERYKFLDASKFAKVATEEADIADVLSTYKGNEVKGDATYKDKALELTGVVREVKKDFTDRIYVELGKGNEPFEHPTLHCFVDDRFTKRVGGLEKGDSLTVKATVKGLIALSVLADPCEPVE